MRLTRRDRIKLLLKTFIDAASPGRGDSDVRSPLGSRAPAKSYLWAQGSYRELGNCVNRLRVEYPRIHRHTLTIYAPDWLERDCQFRGVPHPRGQLYERGMNLLDRWMPENIYVPEEVVMNEVLTGRATYTPGDAKSAKRPMRDRAAA